MILEKMENETKEIFLNWSTVYSTSSVLLASTNQTNETDTTPQAFRRDEELAKIEMAVLALLFILTVFGNFVVLLGIFFRRQKMTRMYYFILHLSVADLITAFFNVLTQLFWEITYRFQGGNLLCKLVKYTQILGPYSSSYVLVVTALDRQQAICYPLSNCTWTARRSKVMLAIAWSISLIFCIPQLFIFSYRQVSTDPLEFDCWAIFPTVWAPKAYVTWYSITVFIIPLVILIFAYGCITRTIWVNFNKKSKSGNQDNFERAITRNNSDEGGEHSSFAQSNNQEGLAFERENRVSFRESKSESPVHTTGASPKNSVRRDLCIPSKYIPFVKASTRTRCLSGGKGESRESCATQATSTSPSLNRRTCCAPLDKKQASSQSNGNFKSNHRNGYNDEHLHLIPLEYERTKIERRMENDNRMKNGNARLSGAPDNCQYHVRRLNNATSFRVSKRDDGSKGKWSNSRLSLPSGRRRRRAESVSGESTSTMLRKQSRKASNATKYVEQQPRTHSVKGISRAKIKTVKLTVTIICCYIFCSCPFIAAQLWSVYDPDATKSAFFTGPIFTILTLLASLNSCVNPFIFLFFNPNLLEYCFHGLFPPRFTSRRFNNESTTPMSRLLSQGKRARFGGGEQSINYHSSVRRSASISHSGSGDQRACRARSRERNLPQMILSSSTILNGPVESRDQRPSHSPIQSGESYPFHPLLKDSKDRDSGGNSIELVVFTSPTPMTTATADSIETRVMINGAENFSSVNKPCRMETTTNNMINNYINGSISTLII